jgi:hypothetical protein
MLRIVSLILLAMLAMGCSDAPKLHPVQGTVTLDDEPVDGAGVVFNPADDKTGLLAAGKTDAQGKYVLRTMENQGAQAGKYKVTVLLTKVVGKEAPEGFEDNRTMIYLVPKKYSDSQTSGLEAEVPGKGAYDLKLTSK